MLKNSLSLFFNIVIFSCLILACKKEDQPAKTSWLTVKHNGILKETNDLQLFVDYFNNWSLVARFPTGDRVDILIEDPKAKIYEGNYLNGPVYIYYSLSDNLMRDSYSVYNFLLKITTVAPQAKEIAGEFSISASNSLADKIQLTEGRFHYYPPTQESKVFIPGK